MKKVSFRDVLGSPWSRWTFGLLMLAAGAFTYPTWWPMLDGWIGSTVAARREASSSANSEAADAHGEDDHAQEDDGHDHAGHDEMASLELSPQSLKNLGLTADFLQPIKLSNFYRTVTIPSIIVAKPGRTNIQVSSPMIGIVQHVHAVSGEAVVQGDLLFEVRLTYEDLVDTQTQLLKNLSDREIEQREVARLEEVTRSGAVASKLLLERQYALQKLESSIASQRAALKLHGLSDDQIDTIISERRLLRDLTIVAPGIETHSHDENDLRLSDRRFRAASFSGPVSFNGMVQQNGVPVEQPIPMTIDQLSAAKGQGVQAGQMLCTLSDYSTLYIEGKAFEQDAPAIAAVAANGWPIEAIVPAVAGQETVPELKVVFVASAVDPQSRTLSFFVNLPNSILRDEKTAEGQRFVTWKYRVGQRLELRVPVEAWENEIVLPVDAAVKDGADWFVFQQNGDHFDRVAVHVKHRDQRYVVIENDGAIFPGDVVALRSAHQMQMAIKNKSGAGADPHAGHNH
ncbi:efflux RND transporter periplasmic adaptor subunit [Pirellulaceae bacterium SH449]